MVGLTRRQFLGATAAVSLVGPALALQAEGLTINPRSSWGSAHPPKGPLETEDVRFLIVHHSASRNGHVAADVPWILRSWFDFHTGPDRGWNDIAYNFIVDSEGGIWEGREGSIAGAIRGDATGGNQGYSQLVCVIGNFDSAAPTSAALDSLVRVMAWLADKHGIATSPGSTTSFTSLGSSRWPAGTQLNPSTIVGHRDMSATSCPGGQLYPYVVGGLMADVQAVRVGGNPTPPTSTSSTTTTPPTTTTSHPDTTSTSAASTTTAQTAEPTSTVATSTTIASTTTTPPTATSVASTTSIPPTPSTLVSPSVLATPTTVPDVSVATSPSVATATAAARGGPALMLGLGGLMAGLGALVVWRRRRMG